MAYNSRERGSGGFDFGIFGQEMNINYWWLEYIKDQIGIFQYYWQGDESPERSLNKMYGALEMLEALVSPKVDDDEIEKNLTWLKNAIPNAHIRDNEGKIVSYCPKLIWAINGKLITTFKLLLVKMERNGLLTIHRIKPGDAMGNFKSA